MAEITIRISDKLLKIAGILLAAALLAWVWPYLWASEIFVPKYRLFVYFPEVSGLAVDAPVTLDGIQVGSVAAIKLAEGPASPERRIQLTLRVDRRYEDAIRSDSVATVISEGLLGRRYVAIVRGFRGSVISANGEIPTAPTREVTFKEFTDSLGKVVDCLEAEKKSPENKTQGTPGTPSKNQP